MNANEMKVYEIIEAKAGSNSFLQGLSGALGWPFTIAMDIGALFTHYAPMLNEIRRLYGRAPMGKDVIMPILKGCTRELVSDVVVDKLVGNLPLIGIPANVIAAKAMTWRLGILFAMLAARGEEVDHQNVQKMVQVIRSMFPQYDRVIFTKPKLDTVSRLIRAVEGNTVETVTEKMNRLLDAMAC